MDKKLKLKNVDVKLLTQIFSRTVKNYTNISLSSEMLVSTSATQSLIKRNKIKYTDICESVEGDVPTTPWICDIMYPCDITMIASDSDTVNLEFISNNVRCYSIVMTYESNGVPMTIRFNCCDDSIYAMFPKVKESLFAYDALEYSVDLFDVSILNKLKKMSRADKPTCIFFNRVDDKVEICAIDATTDSEKDNLNEILSKNNAKACMDIENKIFSMTLDVNGVTSDPVVKMIFVETLTGCFDKKDDLTPYTINVYDRMCKAVFTNGPISSEYIFTTAALV